MKIIVTGAAGFVGSHTVELLEKQGNKVLAIDNFSTGRTENLKKFRGHIFPGDVTDVKMMDVAFSDFQPEAILHLAAQATISIAYSDPQKDLRVNSLGTLNMIELSKKYNVKRFIFSSTSAVYREAKSPLWGMAENFPCEPQSPYGISKLAAEQYIRTMLPDTHLILRYGNIYGPRQVPIGENQVISHIFKHFLFGDEFKLIHNGKQVRDFVYVEDIARLNLIALGSPQTGTFNAATGLSRSVNDILEYFEEIYEVPGYEWERSKKVDPRGSVYINTSKIYSKLGWKAYTSLRDGLKLTSEWWEENK